jgi:hypothetical protein
MVVVVAGLGLAVVVVVDPVVVVAGASVGAGTSVAAGWGTTADDVVESVTRRGASWARWGRPATATPSTTPTTKRRARAQRCLPITGRR